MEELEGKKASYAFPSMDLARFHRTICDQGSEHRDKTCIYGPTAPPLHASFMHRRPQSDYERDEYDSPR